MILSPKTVRDLTARLHPFWALQVFGWLAYWVMISITFLPVLPAGASPFGLLQLKFVRACIGFTLTSLLRPIYKRLLSRGAGLGTTALVSLSMSALLGCVWVVCADIYGWLLNRATFDLGLSLSRAPREALEYGSIVLAWSALYFGIKYGQELRNERERALKADALARQAQLDMLRYQLNPHFLFNALNSLRASINEDPARARRMVTAFSEFLRYTLLKNDSASVPLREELAAVRNYLDIEKIRFEDRLCVTFDVRPARRNLPPPGFLIQPLVENAIKHGMGRGDAPLKLKLTARRSVEGSLCVEVANSGAWVEAGERRRSGDEGAGVGLINVRRRLEQSFPGRHSLVIGERDGWVRASVEIERAG
jgi:two-component system LytT family sensor kinase